MNPLHQEDIRALAAAIPQLPAKDRDFATSLVTGFGRRGVISEKQLYWVHELTRRASGVQAPAEVVVADLTPILATFETAAQHLKRPGYRVALNTTTALRIKVAGASSKYAGQLQLTGDGSFEDRAYFGRIDHEGRFYPGRDARGQEAEVKAALVTFAADPAAAARSYARLFGRCCFCNLALEDERSTAVGYGPVCAKNYGLPWTKTEVREAA